MFRILNFTDKVWKLHRKTLNSTFNLRILNSFLPIFNDSARKLIQQLDQYASTGKTFNILAPLTHCTLGMVCETSFGKKVLEREGKQQFFDNLEV